MNIILRSLISASLCLCLFAQQTDFVKQIQRKPHADAREYAYRLQSGSGVSGTLSSSGSGKVLTFTKCPPGLAVASTVYISGGTGTAEAAAITATTCTAPGGTAGTATVTTANTHTGPWVASSATAGIQEGLVVARASNHQSVVVAPGTSTVYSTIELGTGDVVECAANAAERWASGIYPCKIEYMGTSDLFAASTGVAEVLEVITLRGLSLITTTGRYAINIDASGGGGIRGVLIENVSAGDGTTNSIANGWTRAVNSAGTVYDVTLKRFAATDITGDIIYINNDAGEAGPPNQWRIFDSYLIPTSNNSWAVKATGTGVNDLLGTIVIRDTTVADVSPAGANGVWVHGGLLISGGLYEGYPSSRPSTVGIRVSGVVASILEPQSVLTWGTNVQIGDPTHKTYSTGSTIFRGRALAGWSGTDIQIVDGGSRAGTRIDCQISACAITNQRETVDGVYNEAQYLDATTSPYKMDLRGVGFNAGSATIRQPSSGATTDFIIRNSPIQDGAPTSPPFALQNAAGTSIVKMYPNGSIGLAGIAFADLPATSDWANSGTYVYCTNCTVASNPCTGGSTGAWAFRSGGVWKCPF